MNDLFAKHEPAAPLAERLRPRTLDEVVGQSHLLGPGKPLRLAFESGKMHSMILWGPPGVGKTTLARALARSIGGTFHRLQFTSDLLPSDVVGVSILDGKSGQFEFRPGPVFANLVLADEINRTPPRTQSALLEAMNEGQVSVDGRTYPLESPFLVMATQNADEHYGTYPLPESQMDRFLLRIRIDYPSAEDERRILLESSGRPEDALARLEPVLSVAQVRALQEAAERVRLAARIS